MADGRGMLAAWLAGCVMAASVALWTPWLVRPLHGQDFDEDDGYDQGFPPDAGGPVEDPSIGGAAVQGGAVGNPAIGGPSVMGGPVGDPAIGGAPVEGGPVFDPALRGSALGGAPVEDAPIEGEPLN
jgi:hypothetical protein